MQTFLRVADVLHRPVFHAAKLVAGADGVGRPVRWVHILDVPEVLLHIHGGELVLTTGMGFAGDPARFVTFVEQLLEGQAAGLCVELGSAVHDIPPDIRRLADEAAFPLIVFPSRVRFVDITQDIHKLILLQERQAFFEQDWVEAQLRGTDDDLAIDPVPASPDSTAARHWRVAILSIPDDAAAPGADPSALTADWFNRRADLTIHIRAAFARQHIRSFLSVRADTVVALLEFDGGRPSDKHPWRQRIDSAFSALRTAFGRAGWPGPLTMGVGSAVHDRTLMPRSYADALTARQVCEQVQGGGWLPYDETGIYRWISLVSDHPQAAAYAARDLRPLLDHDRKHHTELMETLKVYLDCDRSKQQTADALFIHRQTLYHRLEQLTELLHVDLDDPVQRLSLHLAVYHHKFSKRPRSASPY